MRRVRLPLNLQAAQAADAALMRETGGRPIDPFWEVDAALRERWLDAYVKAGGEVEEPRLTGRTLGSPIQPCPNWNIDLLYLHANGAPVGGATYVVTCSSGQFLYQGRLGDDGRARICGVPLEHRSFYFYFRDDPRPFEPFPQSAAQPTPEDEDSFIEEVADWLWGALKGDFNEDPTYGQIAFNVLLGLIPVVDTLLDVRDLVAGVLALVEYYNESEEQRSSHEPWLGLDHETWLWIDLFITAIGFIPELGSVIKGVLKALKRYLKSLMRTVESLSPRQLQELWQLLIDTLNSLGLGNAHEWLKQFPSELDGWMADAAQRIRNTLQLLEEFCQQLVEVARENVGWLLDEGQLAAVVDVTRRILAGTRRVSERLATMQARVREWLKSQIESVLNGKHHGERPGAAGTDQSPVINTRQQQAREPPEEPPPQISPRRPTYNIGASDGGPGVWGDKVRGSRGMAYQQQVTGAPMVDNGSVTIREYGVPHEGARDGYVWFDGYDPERGVLLDAKEWHDWPKPNLKFSVDDVVADAQDQVTAARGMPIEWHVPSQDTARRLEKIFSENGILGIDIKVTPVAP